MMESAMVVIKDQIECVLLNFLLKSHGGRHLHLTLIAEKISIANADPIEPYQICAVIGS